MGIHKFHKQYDIKKCIYCGSDITKRSNQSIKKYYTRKFCKLTCQHKWNAQTKSGDVKCDFCGKIHRRKNCRLKEHNFCSEACHQGYRLKRQDMRSIDATCCWCGKHYKKKPSDRKTKKVFCSRKCMGEWQSKYVIGELSYNWNGGVTQLNHRIRSLVKYAEWMKKIYKRDNYTCCVCGDANGGNLNAHYIKPLYKIIRDNNLIDLIDALECSEIWDTNNGKTICEKCHIEEHKGKREE